MNILNEVSPSPMRPFISVDRDQFTSVMIMWKA